MTAPNLFPQSVIVADYTDAAAALAAGWRETGASADIGIVDAPSPAPPVGTKCYLNICASGTGTSNVDSPLVSVVGLSTVSLAVYAKWQTGATPRNYRLDVIWFDADGSTQLNVSVGSQSTATSSWVRYKRENVAVFAGAAFARVRVATLLNANADALAFTGIQIEEGATVSDEIVPTPSTGYKAWLYTGTGFRGLELITPFTEQLSEVETIRAATNAPVNAADTAVQAGDLSGFTTVTTYSALRSALLGGQWVRVNSTINCTGDLKMVTGSALYVDTDGVVLRTYAGGGFIETNQMTGGSGYYNAIVPSHNVYIGGPGKITCDNDTRTGNMIVLGGDNIVLDGFSADLWNGGRYLVLVGDNCRVRRVNWDGGSAISTGSGNGGLRYMGGVGFRCIESYIRSGDDVLQCVPAGNLNDPFFSISIKDVIYMDNSGQSWSGRFMVCGNQDQYDDGVARMNCSIGGPNDADKVRFIENHGYSGGSAIALQNKSSTGTIENVWFERCSVDGSLTQVTSGQPGAVYPNGVTNWVQNIHFIDVEVRNHHKPGLRFGPNGSWIRDIEFVRGRLERDEDDTSIPVVVIPSGALRVALRDTVLARMGSSSSLVTDNGTNSVLDYVEAP